MNTNFNMKQQIIKSIILLIVGAIIGAAIMSFIQPQTVEAEVEERVEQQLELAKNTELTDWQILELAIMKTESEFNPVARGAKGDLGLFQITEIYVEECNRLAGEPHWVHTDAFVPERALEMFNFYQDAHNPSKDYIRAINAHNPGGESIGYSQKVLANMDYIRNYEKIRSQVLEFITE